VKKKNQLLYIFAEVTNRHVCSKKRNKENQAQSEYKHSLTFRVRCYAVTAMKSMHQLQIYAIVHN